MSYAFKWLPVVSQDVCTGCGVCVGSCDHGCLELVWSFATLTRPLDCGSEGICVAACPEDAIRMQWVPTEGSASMGHWEYDVLPPEQEAKGGWLRAVASWLQKPAAVTRKPGLAG
jgi:Na+-translocating ferredoxin:NAD+ oxidoreductase RNF subunit RnfB